MRFYMIVVRPLVDPQEILAKPTQIRGFTLIGLLLSLQLTGWILATQIDGQNQPAFTLACEVPNMKMPSRSWRKSLYIYILSIPYLAALTLLILMVYKVKNSTRATPDSPHFKLAVYTSFQVMGFALMAFATILVKSVNSTNITRVSLIQSLFFNSEHRLFLTSQLFQALIISFCGAFINAFIPTLMFWTSTESWWA